MSLVGLASTHKLLKAQLMRTEAFYVLNGSNEISKCKTKGSDDIKESV
jgi:hypothetical protein